MDFLSALSQAAKILHKNKIKFPHLEAEILLSYITKKNREYIFTYPQNRLTKRQLIKFKTFIAKRTEGIPMAYLTGYKEFYGLKFFVNKNVLIPRPETELLIDEVKNILKINFDKRHSMPTHIIDVGTGSGCIIISLIKSLENIKINFFATDISKNALSVARKNAKLHGIFNKINFLNGNLIEPIIKKRNLNSKTNYIIIANLPYLTPAQINNSSSIKKEPRLALTAGKDGLRYYKKLFQQIKQNSLFNGVVLCEIDSTQKHTITNLIKKELPESKFEIKKDLGGHNRLVVIRLSDK